MLTSYVVAGGQVEDLPNPVGVNAQARPACFPGGPTVQVPPPRTWTRHTFRQPYHPFHTWIFDGCQSVLSSRGEYLPLPRSLDKRARRPVLQGTMCYQRGILKRNPKAPLIGSERLFLGLWSIKGVARVRMCLEHKDEVCRLLAELTTKLLKDKETSTLSKRTRP